MYFVGGDCSLDLQSLVPAFDLSALNILTFQHSRVDVFEDSKWEESQSEVTKED